MSVLIVGRIMKILRVLTEKNLGHSILNFTSMFVFEIQKVRTIKYEINTRSPCIWVFEKCKYNKSRKVTYSNDDGIGQ